MSDERITVIFSTHNNAEMLRNTMEAMAELDCGGLSVEFVVVDNNSSDDTGTVIDSFRDKIPLVQLFEKRPGKNCALNHALDSVEWGDILVFTDDDVLPERDWLHQVARSCREHPDYSVFGGKCVLVWPEGAEVPPWAGEPSALQSTVFSPHDLGNDSRQYRPGEYPNGPNLWIRRAIFDTGLRYDENVGPRPGGKFRMGSEAALMKVLADAGHNFLYYPAASVGHCVPADRINIPYARARLRRSGQGLAYRASSKNLAAWNRNRVTCLGGRLAALLKWSVRYVLASMTTCPNVRIQRQTEPLRWLHYNLETLRILVSRDSGA